MEFILQYRGELSANGKPAEKHQIRKVFHAQLQELWRTHSLLEGTTTKELTGRHQGDLCKMPRVDWIALKHEVGRFHFVPLITPDLSLVCTLDIQFLRREPVGTLVNHGGDIDNRIKTLFDALTMPSEAQVKKETPDSTEIPFYCLLQDDALIAGFCVQTEPLLEPIRGGKKHSEVVLNIRVKVVSTLSSPKDSFDRLKGVKIKMEGGTA